MTLVWRPVEPSSLVGNSLFPGVPALCSPVSRHHKARYTDRKGVSVEKSQVWVTFAAIELCLSPAARGVREAPRAEQHRAVQAPQEPLTCWLLPLPNLGLGLVLAFPPVFASLCSPSIIPRGCRYHGICICVFMYTTYKPVCIPLKVPLPSVAAFLEGFLFPLCARHRAIQSAVTRQLPPLIFQYIPAPKQLVASNQQILLFPFVRLGCCPHH